MDFATLRVYSNDFRISFFHRGVYNEIILILMWSTDLYPWTAYRYHIFNRFLWMLSNIFLPFPVSGWQNVALSSLGSACQATSEYDTARSCTKALDGLTRADSQWVTKGVGAGVKFYVRHFTSIHLVTPVWGDFMFSVRFHRRVHVCHRRRNDFYISRQNRLS